MEKRIRYIYKITNKVNGKTYIGQRALQKKYKNPLADMYWGSGTAIRRAEKKYGLKSFEKEILIKGFFSQEEIDRFEKCAIRIERFLGKAEYNICDGGQGCRGQQWYEKNLIHTLDLENRKLRSKRMKETVANMSLEDKEIWYSKISKSLKGHEGFFKNKHHSEDTKKKLREIALQQNRTGKNNGSYGKHWYTNGQTNIKCENCPEGFRPGRV